MAKDPICGMEVEESQAAGRLKYKGQMFYFCARSCYDAFEKDPGKYLSSKEQRWWNRFLNRLAQATQETYGGKPPKCH